MSAQEYFTPELRRRALAYTLAVSRGDPHRSEVLADLDGNELQRTVETLAMLHAASLERLTGNADAVLTSWLQELQNDEDENAISQEGN
ncbi:hypothetical protein [Nesterenkonia halobia]|uniref:Uncharacterized protein n=1 Tax=Nesterenkonia halobia TaxID=37922 RepID=A0ABP6RCU6_9MICC